MRAVKNKGYARRARFCYIEFGPAARPAFRPKLRDEPSLDQLRKGCLPFRNSLSFYNLKTLFRGGYLERLPADYVNRESTWHDWMIY